MKNNQFLALSNEIMKTSNPLHYELFNFDNNIEFKVFLMVLSVSTMLYRKNGMSSQKFKLGGLLGRDSYLPRSKLNYQSLEKLINKLNNKRRFFDCVLSEDKSVFLRLSKEYMNNINNTGFNKINLEDLKTCKDIKATKLKVIISIRQKGYLHLNYLFKILSIKSDLNRSDRIRQVKRAFNGIKLNFEYKHPKNQNDEIKPEHFIFYYDSKNENQEGLDDIIF